MLCASQSNARDLVLNVLDLDLLNTIVNTNTITKLK